MGDIENIETHMANICECGSVNFNLLKSGKIECAGDCQRRFGKWSDDDTHEWECPECEQVGNYADIRRIIDRGVDHCPDCNSPVKCMR